MPRLVRRTPLLERIKSNLDPYDLLLWLSEELNNDVYEEWLQDWGTLIGIGLNIVFILARGASKTLGSGADDVFGEVDGTSGSGWLSWLAAILVQILTLLCVLNAAYTFFRKRHYRLFEQDVEVAPATPSAQLVRVDSSPAASSPLRYLQNVISSTAVPRSYPDAEREVWELGVWDPKPFNLTIFTLFSPGHLLLYYSLLPPAPLDPRPSLTVFTAILFGALLSVQLSLLKTSYSQQAKDSALIQGQVMNEYNTKFVHPSLYRPVRDVGIQARESSTSPRGTKTREVDVYTPTTIIKRGFRTNPNTNYTKQYDPDNLSSQATSRRQSGASTPVVETPMNGYANAYTQSTYSRPSTGGADFSSPLKPHHERLRERSPMKGDGGSLGVYSHAASPLRKATSTSQIQSGSSGLDRRVAGPLSGTSTLAAAGSGSRLDGVRRRETGRF